MLIESAVNTKFIRTLTFGLFPKNVLELQESQDFFEQTTFIDYQLQLILHNEYQSEDLLPPVSVNGGYERSNAHFDKLRQLIDYAVSIAANYNDSSKSYHESLYYVCVLAHLHYLNNDNKELLRVLGSVFVNPVETEDELVRYLHCRYKTLQGLVSLNDSVWIDYLVNWKALFNRSNVAANRWLEMLLDRFTQVLCAGGTVRIEFTQLRQLPLAANAYSMISVANYLSRHTNSGKIDAAFKQEYSAWLNKLLEQKMKATDVKFPHAMDTSHSDLNTFVDNLYEGLSGVLYYYKLLRPSVSKKFLVYCTTMTYQSQTVLSNLIKTLIDLNEFDEAYAAMKTYIRYLHMGQEQQNGYIDNILGIIDLYNVCLLAFNPLDSIITKKKFKYTSNHLVVEFIESLTGDLLRYLKALAEISDLTYDVEKEEGNEKSDELSFLYRKYNLNLLLSDKSLFISIVSNSWLGLGRFYQFMSTYEAPTEAKLLEYNSKVLEYYKNGLIVNSTGNLELLFNYALTLSYNHQLNQASKLCKFILKKFPESFKTWNLLVLILTLFELYNPDKNVSGSSNANTTLNTETSGTRTPTTTINKVYELEKIITNALNIAALFIENYNETQGGAVKLSFETKYHIIQLKLTHLAVLESIYGSNYILEFLPDLFGLFHELFEYQDSHKVHSIKSNNGGATSEGDNVPHVTDTAWSHRPSFIDPKVGAAAAAKASRASHARKSTDIEHISEKLRTLSKTATRTHHKLPLADKSITSPSQTASVPELKLLQDLWLWTSSLYAKIGNLEQAEECIVEAETVYELNIKTFSRLGLLTSKSRKFLSLQEFEKALEKLFREGKYYNKKDFGFTLLGLCKLFIIDDKLENSLFISATDLDAGVIRLKNYLEKFILCWPYGYNLPEVWWYLSLIYEKIDDKILLNKSLWKCIELEDIRPVRDFSSTVLE